MSGAASPVRRYRLAAFVFLLALVGFVALTAHGGLWEKFGVEHMRPFFADTVTTLAASETWAEGGDPYEDNYRDPYKRPHSYGPWWLWAAKFGLERRDAWWLGTLQVLAFLAAAAAVLAPRTPTRAAVALLLLLSPATLLGMERANSDLVVFVLLVLGAWTAARWRGAAGDVAGGAVLVAAGALKFYPLVSVVALGARPGSVARRVLVGLACGAAFAAVWWLHREHFQRALGEAARPGSVFAYGLLLAPVSWESLPAGRPWLVAGGLLGLAAGLPFVARGWRALGDALPLYGGRAAAAVAGGSAWVLCYVATTNFPYRTVLLLALVPFWLDGAAGRAGRWLLGLLVLVLWLGAPKYWLAYPEMLAQPHWRRTLTFLSGFDQGAWLALTAAVAVMLAGWAWRRLRAPAP